MTDRQALRRELLDIIETHKEGFGSGTPESQRIDALIDELAPLTPYPQAIDHPEIYQGHWVAVYHNIGKLVGGAAALLGGPQRSSTLTLTYTYAKAQNDNCKVYHAA